MGRVPTICRLRPPPHCQHGTMPGGGGGGGGGGGDDDDDNETS
jgi:hypothetical protein